MAGEVGRQWAGLAWEQQLRRQWVGMEWERRQATHEQSADDERSFMDRSGLWALTSQMAHQLTEQRPAGGQESPEHKRAYLALCDRFLELNEMGLALDDIDDDLTSEQWFAPGAPATWEQFEARPLATHWSSVASG